MAGEYTATTFTIAADMYKCYQLAKLLNPKLTECDYESVIDRITASTNYVQHVVLFDGDPVSFCATQDNLNMSVAPALSCKVNNIATLPEHRGAVTKIMLAGVVEEFRAREYDNLNLSVLKGNDRAINFYVKNGFNSSGETWTLRLQNETPRARL